MSAEAPESMPVFDVEDLRLVGWEWGTVPDGDMVVQFRCPCGCGISGALKLPPGAYIAHDPPGTFEAKDVEFHGPMKAAERQEP